MLGFTTSDSEFGNAYDDIMGSIAEDAKSQFPALASKISWLQTQAQLLQDGKPAQISVDAFIAQVNQIDTQIGQASQTDTIANQQSGGQIAPLTIADIIGRTNMYGDNVPYPNAPPPAPGQWPWYAWLALGVAAIVLVPVVIRELEQ